MRFLSALLLAFISANASGDDHAVAVDYIRARCATLVRGASEVEVERVLALIKDDAVIEHPMFGAVVKGKEAIRRGLVSHLAEYTGDRQESGIVVLGSVQSPGVVAFRTKTTFAVGEGSARRIIAREGLTVVEIKDGRISRLIEY